MKKLILLSTLFLFSCVDQNKRLNYLKKQFPQSIVEPATGVIQQSGFDFIVISEDNQIIAVDFYPFSERKISNMRNIR
jgi:hypothetical protein